MTELTDVDYSASFFDKGRRDSAGVRALDCYDQCRPGSIPGLGVIFWLSLLFSSLLREVFPGYFDFPFCSKTNISKFQFDLESEGHRVVSHNRLVSFTLVEHCYLIN